MYEEMMPATDWLGLGWREIRRMTLAACAVASGPQRRRWSRCASVALAHRSEVREINIALGVCLEDLASHDHWLRAVTEPLSAALAPPPGNGHTPRPDGWQRPKRPCRAPAAPQSSPRRPTPMPRQEDVDDDDEMEPVSEPLSSWRGPSSPSRAGPGPGPGEISIKSSWEDPWARRRLRLIDDLVQQTIELYRSASSCGFPAVLGITHNVAYSLLVMRSWVCEVAAFSTDGALPSSPPGHGLTEPHQRLVRSRGLWSRLLAGIGTGTPQQQATYNLLSSCMPLVLTYARPAAPWPSHRHFGRPWIDLHARLCDLADEPVSGADGSETHLESARAAAKTSMGLFIRTFCPANPEHQAGNGEAISMLSALLPVRPILSLIGEADCLATLLNVHGLARLLVATSDWVLLTNRRFRCLVHLGLCAHLQTWPTGEARDRGPSRIRWVDDLVGRETTWAVLFDGRRPPATEAEARCWMSRLFVKHEAATSDLDMLIKVCTRRAESYIDDGPFGWVAHSTDNDAEQVVHKGWVSAVKRRLSADVTHQDLTMALMEDVQYRCGIPPVGVIFRRVLEHAPQYAREAGLQPITTDNVAALDSLLVESARRRRLTPRIIDLLRCGDQPERPAPQNTGRR